MAGGSKTAVYGAIAANSLVMVAKFIGFFVTGSGTMLAEGIHSVADVGNQALLVVGMKRSQQPADDEHPFGYGRDAFIWALMSAVGIFFLGCGVTVAHGVHTLLEGHSEVGSQTLNIGILVLALVAEGASLGLAVKGLWAEARGRELGFWEHIRTTDDPFGVAVLMEDSAAVFGVVLALITVGLGAWTGHAYWDGIGSLLIGVLLGFVAFFLMRKNRAMLIGQAISKKDRDRLMEVLEGDEAIEKVALTRAVVTGADSWRISAEIELDGHVLADKWLEGRDLSKLQEELREDAEDLKELRSFLGDFADDIVEMTGDEVDRIEARIREVIPHADHVDIEAD